MYTYYVKSVAKHSESVGMIFDFFFVFFPQMEWKPQRGESFQMTVAYLGLLPAVIKQKVDTWHNPDANKALNHSRLDKQLIFHIYVSFEGCCLWGTSFFAKSHSAKNNYLLLFLRSIERRYHYITVLGFPLDLFLVKWSGQKSCPSLFLSLSL